MRPPAQGVGRPPATETRRGTPERKQSRSGKRIWGRPTAPPTTLFPQTALDISHRACVFSHEPEALQLTYSLVEVTWDSPCWELFPGTLLSSLSSTQAPCRPSLPQPAQALAALRSDHVPSGAVVRAVSHRGVSSLLTAAHVTSLLRAGTLADGHRRPVSQKR